MNFKKLSSLFLAAGLLCSSSFIGLASENGLSSYDVNVAKWIAPRESQSATNTWLCFRKNFELKELPGKVNARIAADTKYWMWINEELVVFEGEVKRGPNPNDTYYDNVEIGQYLKEGKNNISILVWYFGKQGFSYNPSGIAALFFDARNEKGDFKLVSDKSWISNTHPAYYTPAQPDPNFRLPESCIGFDANYDFGKKWYSMDYKTRHPWRISDELGLEGDEPWGKLVDRIIPQWKNYGMADYVKTELVAGEVNDTLKCWLPYNAQVTPYFQVEAQKGDKIIMHTDHYKGGGPFNLRAEYICRDGKQEYESLGWLNGHKMYYIFPKTVKVLKVQYRETSYDADFAGSFTSNDAFCNKMWEKARRTLLVTMRDTYMDCPDRERAQWWGDAVNESGEAFYALDPKSHLLMKKGMLELINWQRENGTIYAPIPASNYSNELPAQMLAAVSYYGFWNYYQHTGDKETMAAVYDGVRRYLKVWKFNEDGSIKFRPGDWTWGDWGSNRDIEAIYNAWYYIALKGSLKMAQLLGKDDDAMEYELQMKILKEAFNKKFWKNGQYRTPSYEKETDDRVHALAVVGGLADADKYDEIFKVFQTQWYASPYMEKYVMEALYIMGKEEYAIERMKKRFDEQVNDPNCSTLYEGWGVGIKGYGGGTMNHAWSGGALTIFSQYACGISPIEPGYKVIGIRPQPAGFEHAAAEVESVQGHIKSAFMNGKKAFELEVTIPEGATGVISIPAARVKSITCNGTQIWRGSKAVANELAQNGHKEEGYIHFDVKAGSYSFKALK